jgi:hypothetical protein
LGGARSRDDNLFVKMKNTIQSYAKGTIFEEGFTVDYYTFAQKWRRVISGPLPPYELQKILRKLVIEGEAPKLSKNDL